MEQREAFEPVARAVVEPVRRFLARRTDPATADDVLGETLLVLWRRSGELPEDPVPWAIGVARLQLANAERGRHRRHRLAVRFGSVEPTSVPDPTDGVAAALDDAVLLRSALARLRPADAELLRLAVWDELTTEQLAGLLGITTNAVALRLSRARNRLRAEVAGASDRAGAAPDTQGRGKGDR